MLFASELAAIHVPGIRFPWGVGLPLGECASVALDFLLFVLLLRRLWAYAGPGPSLRGDAPARNDTAPPDRAAKPSGQLQG